jgi:hypothetical protein
MYVQRKDGRRFGPYWLLQHRWSDGRRTRRYVKLGDLARVKAEIEACRARRREIRKDIDSAVLVLRLGALSRKRLLTQIQMRLWLNAYVYLLGRDTATKGAKR